MERQDGLKKNKNKRRNDRRVKSVMRVHFSGFIIGRKRIHKRGYDSGRGIKTRTRKLKSSSGKKAPCLCNIVLCLPLAPLYSTLVWCGCRLVPGSDVHARATVQHILEAILSVKADIFLNINQIHSQIGPPLSFSPQGVKELNLK